MRMTRNFIIAAILVTLSLTLIACEPNNIQGKATQTLPEPIKIGVVTHLSGDYASYGIPMKEAVVMATEEINKKGGIDGRTVKLFIEDDNSDSATASTAMAKLSTIDDVDYVVSAQISRVTSAITPIAKEQETLLMATLATAPGLTEDNDFVFRTIPSDVAQAKKIVSFIEEGERVAGLYLNGAYGKGIEDIVQENEDVVASEFFSPSTTDFKTQLSKIKSKEPEVIVLAADENSYPSILKQIHELDISATIVASETFKSENVLDKTGELAEGVYTTFSAPQEDFVNFEKRFEERFEKSPSAYNKYAYDGAYALFKAIDTGKEVQDALQDIEFKGASGTVSFSEQGEREGNTFSMYQVRNNEFVQVG